MNNNTIKELKKICKKNKIKGYSKLNKADLIKKIKGGNKKSCHNYDANPEECNKTIIKKSPLNKYSCQFIIHNKKLSQCIKKKNLSKYKDYKIYKVSKKDQKKSKRIIEIPDLNAKEIQSDLNRYLKGDKIKLIINKKIESVEILKNKKSFISKIEGGEKFYKIIKSLISPNFHNDENVSTFKNCIITKEIFKTLECLDFIMCNVEIKEIIIEIQNISIRKNIIIKEYMGGDFKCFGSNKLMQRKVGNNYIKMEWDIKNDNKVIMSYH
jgi:hypothetical protein